MSLRASASRFFLCALCVLCGEKFSYAAEIRTLTLDQAISIAMEKNRDIEKAREYSRYVQGKYVEERSAARMAALSLPQVNRGCESVRSSDVPVCRWDDPALSLIHI